MKTSTLLLALITVALVACESGPSGIDPGQELKISYTDNLGQPQSKKFSANLIVSGDVVPIVSTFYQSSSVTSNAIRFYAAAVPSPTTGPSMILTLGKTLPSGPTTIAWEKADVSGGNPNSVLLTTGPMIEWNFVKYFPVEGSITLTSFVVTGSTIVSAVGYCNGTLQDVNGNQLVCQSFSFQHPRP